MTGMAVPVLDVNLNSESIEQQVAMYMGPDRKILLCVVWERCLKLQLIDV